MNKNAVLVGVLLIVFAAGGFFAGMQYQQSQSNSLRQRFAGGFGARNGQFMGAATNRNNSRPVSGEIISADSKNLTVKMPDGSSKIVLFSDKTSINKAAAGSVSDLKAGERVFVSGATNSDGTVSADMIQLNPLFQRGQVPSNGPNN